MAAGEELDDELASTGLLSFYDRLRERLVAGLERRSGRAGRGAAQVLLLAPDLFILVARLALDRQVPAPTRRFLAGALVYFVTPIDLLPEGLVGPGGYLEDAVLLAAVLSMALGPSLEPLAERYWSGSQRLRVVLGDVGEAGFQLLGPGLYRRLERLLRRWGIRLPQETDGGGSLDAAAGD